LRLNIRNRGSAFGDAATYKSHALSRRTKSDFGCDAFLGCGDLWITEYILSYDGQPSHTVSTMEFRDGKVVRETQYFGDPFEASTWRAQWVERFE
jgi:hypothetical protein